MHHLVPGINKNLDISPDDKSDSRVDQKKVRGEFSDSESDSDKESELKEDIWKIEAKDNIFNKIEVEDNNYSYEKKPKIIFVMGGPGVGKGT